MGAELLVGVLELLIFKLKLTKFVALLGGGARHRDEDGAEDDNHAAQDEDEHGDGLVGGA